MANTVVAGYPAYCGNKFKVIFDHTGPKSYGNIGTNSGTGDVIKASDLGIGGFDGLGTIHGGFIEGYTNSGNFILKIFTSASGTTPSQAPPLGGAFPQGVAQWFTTSAAFGAISTEVANTTDLSAEVIRLECWGV